MLEAVAMDNALSNRMLTAVCARIQRLVDAISSTASGTASLRVASYLLEQLERSPRTDACIVLPAPKKAIASLLNLTPETLSRVLRMWGGARFDARPGGGGRGWMPHGVRGLGRRGGAGRLWTNCAPGGRVCAGFDMRRACGAQE